MERGESLDPLDLLRRRVERIDDRLNLLRGGAATAQAKAGGARRFSMARITEPAPPRPIGSWRSLSRAKIASIWGLLPASAFSPSGVIV